MKVIDRPITHKDLNIFRNSLIPHMDKGFEEVLAEIRNIKNMLSADLKRANQCRDIPSRVARFDESDNKVGVELKP